MSDLRPILIETIQLNADAQTFERKLVEGGDAILRCYFKQGVSPADVTGCTITAYIANAAATVVRSFSGTIIDAEGGQVDIALEGDDIDFSGDGYDFSVKLVDGDGNEIYQRLGDLEIFPKVPESATPVAGSVVDWSAFTGYTNTATDGPYRAGTNITSTTNADGSETHSLTDPPAVDGVQLNTDGALPDATGLVRWNDTDKCVEYCTVNGTIIQIGQELGTYARNSTGTLIANGQVVYVSGATGNRPTITLAQANSFASSEKTIGLVTGASGIANNSDGFVTTFGLVRGLDTSAYSEGQELYLSPSVAGGLTATVPTGLTEFVVSLGIVTRVSPSVGEILVRPHYMGSVTGYTVNNATTTLAARTAIGAADDTNVVKKTGETSQSVSGVLHVEGNFTQGDVAETPNFTVRSSGLNQVIEKKFDTGNLFIRSANGTLPGTAGSVVINDQGTGGLFVPQTAPHTDNTTSLGTSSRKWLSAHISTLYTGVVQALTASGIALKDSTGTTQATVDSSGLSLTTDLAVTDGGTGASDAATARANLQVSQKEIDLFILAGQSNAVGFGGTAGLAPTVPSGIAYQWTSAGGVQELPDATNDELAATIAPAFAVKYNALTGRVSAWVLSATNGSAQVAAADYGVGNWDTTGSLRGSLVTAHASAVSALEVAGWKVRTAGIIWMQGEQDAVKILDATITATQYKTALQTMISYFRTNIDAALPFYIVKTGIRTGVSDSGSLNVRLKQQEVAEEDVLTDMVYFNTVNFNLLGWLADTVHYNQSGLNNIGYLSANRVVRGFSVAGPQRISVTADNQTVVVGESEYIRATSDNATAANRTLVLSQPTRTGQNLVIENTSGNNIQLLDGGALAEGIGTLWLNGDWSSAGQKHNIKLVADGANWFEVSRATP